MATVVIELEAQKCGECGVVFGIEGAYLRSLMQSHRVFYCPNGHGLRYTGKSESEKLRDEVTRTQAALDQAWARIDEKNRELAAQRRSAAAVKGVLTKVKKRISGGVCPCCNRYFKALHRHMTTQHPEASQVEE